MDLERDLNKTIEMINSDSTYRFDRVYPFATENVGACLSNYDFMYFSNIMQYVSEMYNDNMINSLSKYRELLLKFKELLNKGGSMYASYIYGIDLLAIPNMDAFCLASIEHVFEHDLIEYKSFNAFKNKFSAFVEGASKDGVLVYSK